MIRPNPNANPNPTTNPIPIPYFHQGIMTWVWLRQYG